MEDDARAARHLQVLDLDALGVAEALDPGHPGAVRLDVLGLEEGRGDERVSALGPLVLSREACLGGLAVEEPAGIAYLDRVGEDVDLHRLPALVIGVREPVHDGLANRGHRELRHLPALDARPLDDDPPADVREDVELRFAGAVEERPLDLLDVEDVDPVAGAEHPRLQHGRPGLAEEGRSGVGQPALRGEKAEALQGIHPHDVASILDEENVPIRAGHHCAQPLLAWLGCESCCRASLAFYNDARDIDALIDGLKVVWRTFHG